jgi:hypothetical protein
MPDKIVKMKNQLIERVWNYPGATFYNKPFSAFKLIFGYSSLFKKYQNYMQNGELTEAQTICSPMVIDGRKPGNCCTA